MLEGPKRGFVLVVLLCMLSIENKLWKFSTFCETIFNSTGHKNRNFGFSTGNELRVLKMKWLSEQGCSDVKSNTSRNYILR